VAHLAGALDPPCLPAQWGVGFPSPSPPPPCTLSEMDKSFKRKKEKESMYQERREGLKRALFPISVSMQMLSGFIAVIYLEGTENDLHA